MQAALSQKMTQPALTQSDGIDMQLSFEVQTVAVGIDKEFLVCYAGIADVGILYKILIDDSSFNAMIT